MRTTTTLSETLAAVRKRSAAKLAVVKSTASKQPQSLPPLAESEKQLIQDAAKLGAEWRTRANDAGW